MADRVPCEGKACPRARSPRDADPWPRWLCPKCWNHVRADTAAGIIRLRGQLGKATRKLNIADAHDISRRLVVQWRQAVMQASDGNTRKPKEGIPHANPAE